MAEITKRSQQSLPEPKNETPYVEPPKRGKIGFEGLEFPRGIARKLVEVQSALAFIPKLGRNKAQGYDFLRHEDLVMHANAALTKCGIFTSTRYEIRGERTFTTKSGTDFYMVTVEAIVELKDSETGDVHEIRAFGSGADNADKAIMKAQTAALKYAYTSSFVVSTGDDPEADDKVDEDAPRKQQAAPSAKPTPKAEPARVQHAGGGPRKAPNVDTVAASDISSAMRAASRPPAAHDANVSFKFGPAPELPLRDMDEAQLRWYEASLERSVLNPTKPQYKAYDEKKLAAVRAELALRMPVLITETDEIPY